MIAQYQMLGLCSIFQKYLKKKSFDNLFETEYRLGLHNVS